MKDDNRKPTTTDAGIPYPATSEQMVNFNRERIPERQPHPKGSGSFGHFEVTKDQRLHQNCGVPAGH